MYKSQFYITALSIIAGAIGYLIAKFWVDPVLRYRKIKFDVASDLVFYANAIELMKSDGTERNDTLARKDAQRRHAADLKAIYEQLPRLFRWCLKVRSEEPMAAYSELIGLCNSSTRDEGHEAKERNVKRYLRLCFMVDSKKLRDRFQQDLPS